MPTPLKLVAVPGSPGFYTLSEFAAGEQFEAEAIKVHSAAADGITDDTARFVAAANEAIAAGTNFVVAPRGTYHCPGMTSDDMGGVYIVGDVKFTADTYVAAFSPAELARNAVRAQRTPKAGSGMIAIEIDDAANAHWTSLFPVCKDLGIVLGTAWPTNYVRPWIKEVYRHGWELIAHGHDHEDFTLLTEAQLETVCQASVAAISAITGNSDDIGLVVPSHFTNATVLKICKKYFVRGRYRAQVLSHTADEPSAWDVGAIPQTVWFDNGLTTRMKQYLRNIAATNGRAVFYFHYIAHDETLLQNFRDFVEYAQELGISIEQPKRVCGNSMVSTDPFFEDTAQWVLDTPTKLSWDTTRSFHGTRSLKVHHTGTGISGLVRFRFGSELSLPVVSEFLAVRFSFRYYAEAPVNFSTSYSAGGIRINGSGSVRTTDMEDVTINLSEWVPRYPTSGGELPISTWDKISMIAYVAPDRRYFFPWWRIDNLGEGHTPFWIDDFRIELVDKVPAIKGTVTLNGTTGVVEYVPLMNLSSCSVVLSPKASVAGRLYHTVSGNALSVFSTDATDTTQSVEYTILPGISYQTLV